LFRLVARLIRSSSKTQNSRISDVPKLFSRSTLYKVNSFGLTHLSQAKEASQEQGARIGVEYVGPFFPGIDEENRRNEEKEALVRKHLFIYWQSSR